MGEGSFTWDLWMQEGKLNALTVQQKQAWPLWKGAGSNQFQSYGS